jgi:hypothetical protein
VRACEHCGDLFPPTRDDRRFCTQRCVERAWHARQPKVVRVRYCRACDERFVARREVDRFCSSHCGREFLKATRRVVGQCDYCGAEFWGRQGRRWCSSFCQCAARPKPVVASRTCPTCGVDFVRRGRGLYCTPRCIPPRYVPIEKPHQVGSFDICGYCTLPVDDGHAFCSSRCAGRAVRRERVCVRCRLVWKPKRPLGRASAQDELLRARTPSRRGFVATASARPLLWRSSVSSSTSRWTSCRTI